MNEQRFPKGWDEQRVKRLIADLDARTDEEFIVADEHRPLLLESRKLGAARMTAQFIKSDPIDGDELKALLSHYDQELTPIVEAIKGHKIAGAVGTSADRFVAMVYSELKSGK